MKINIYDLARCLSKSLKCKDCTLWLNCDAIGPEECEKKILNYLLTYSTVTIEVKY